MGDIGRNRRITPRRSGRTRGGTRKTRGGTRKRSGGTRGERAKREAEAAQREAERAQREAEREAERAKSDAAWQRRMDNIASQIGGFTDNYGEALEEEFVAALRDEKRIGDISLHKVEHRLRRDKYEVDIAAQNGRIVAVGEIKHKLGKWDVVRFSRDKLPLFAGLFPDIAKNRKVLGMIGGDLITDAAAAEAKRRGLIILRLKNKKIFAENAKGARPVVSAK